MRIIPLLAASMAVSHAAEFTAEAKPFRVERAFTATLLPATASLVAIEPAGWSEFTIDEIAPHGRRVAKGDLLVKFEREAIDRKLEDLRRAVKARELALANQEWSFAKLVEETTLKQETARRASRVAAEELDYFTKTGRKAQEDEARDDLENSGHRLEATREELKQLRMMYEADDLTEQTEEIILKRQEYAVKSAELGLKLAELSTARTLEVLLPRRAEDLATSAKTAALEWEKIEKNSPREVERARLDLEAARTAAARELEELADLEKDAALMEIRAESDGMFYHGALADGRWQLGELAKSLVKGGAVPLVRPFATLVPSTAKLGLTAHVDETTARSLSEGLEGALTAGGREDIVFSGKVAELATVPAGDGKFRIDLDAAFNDALPLAPGMNFDCRFIVYRKDSAIAIPLKALQAADAGKWQVELKMADGKNQAREVTRGRVAGDRVEIPSGLESGQVLVIPD